MLIWTTSLLAQESQGITTPPLVGTSLTRPVRLKWSTVRKTWFHVRLRQRRITSSRSHLGADRMMSIT
jgi:hypothetical protein